MQKHLNIIIHGYVLDPCLSFLCKKSDYSKIFEIDVKGKVSAKAVREKLIRQVTAPKEEDNAETCKSFQSFMKKYMENLMTVV